MQIMENNIRCSIPLKEFQALAQKTNVTLYDSYRHEVVALETLEFETPSVRRINPGHTAPLEQQPDHGVSVHFGHIHPRHSHRS